MNEGMKKKEERSEKKEEIRADQVFTRENDTHSLLFAAQKFAQVQNEVTKGPALLANAADAEARCAVRDICEKMADLSPGDAGGRYAETDKGQLSSSKVGGNATGRAAKDAFAQTKQTVKRFAETMHFLFRHASAASIQEDSVVCQLEKLAAGAGRRYIFVELAVAMSSPGDLYKIK